MEQVCCEQQLLDRSSPDGFLEASLLDVRKIAMRTICIESLNNTALALLSCVMKRPQHTGYPWQNIIRLDPDSKGMWLFYRVIAKDVLTSTGFHTNRHHIKHSRGSSAVMEFIH